MGGEKKKSEKARYVYLMADDNNNLFYIQNVDEAYAYSETNDRQTDRTVRYTTTMLCMQQQQ